MIDIDELKFDEKGLIPAIVVDAVSKRVLTLAYMNRESLQISMEKGLTCFWSRSRQELWLKGETSGNYQHIVSITADCDRDALVVMVEKDGPACHLGTDSCFNDPVWESDERHEFSLEGLMTLIQGRKTDLLQIIAALHLACRLTGLLDRRKKQTNEHPNDRDDDQQFNECKGLTAHLFTCGLGNQELKRSH